MGTRIPTRVRQRSSAPDRVDPGRWHGFIHWLCQWIYYSRVRLVHPERLPTASDIPVLYLSTHRNGAIDGFVLHALFPRITFLITSNLRRSRFLRLFFSGIEVIRRKDRKESPGGRREANSHALDRCHRHLGANGQLLVFPEGTSTLGPHHLPFQSGAARILLRFLEAHPRSQIAVVPLGIHYERAWAFRSRVEVVVGKPLCTKLEPWTSRRTRLGTLKARIRESLETVGANFSTAESQSQCEAAAYASTLGTKGSYAKALKRFEGDVPNELAQRWDTLRRDAAWPGLWRHQGIPLFPIKNSLLPVYACWFTVTAPFVALGVVLNAPPLLVAVLAGRFGADDRNVVALWRILVGLPAMLIWIALLALVAGATGLVPLLGCHAAISAVAFLSYYRVKKLAVTIHNGLCAPRMRTPARRFHHAVLKANRHEHTDITVIDSIPAAN